MRNLYGHHFTLKPRTQVYVPTAEGRVRGDEIKTEIEARWFPPANYYHLKNGGHVAAARVHKDAKFLVRLDIAKFFDCVSRTKVHRALKGLGMPHLEAWEAACDSVVDKSPPMRAFSIPYGFVQSPIVSSLVLAGSALGREIQNLAGPSIASTVYVDDICLSSESSSVLADGVERLRRAADASGFEFNEAKTQGPAKSIKSFNLEIGSGTLRVTDSRLAAFSERLPFANAYQAHGILGYVGSVSPAQADELAEAAAG